MKKTNIFLLTLATAFMHGGSLMATQTNSAPAVASETVMYSGLVFPGYLTNTMSYVGGKWASNGASVSGWNATKGVYYINGMPASSLSQAGNGEFNGVWYANGTTNGWNSDSGYVLNGVLVGVDQGLNHNGTGTWNGQYYLNGHPYTPANPSGYDATSSNYYIDGQIATLTPSGNGIFNGLWYANGTTNGWNPDSGYVLNGVLVGIGQGLDQSGTGTWNGQQYLNGQPISPAGRTGYDAETGNYYVNGQIATLSPSGNGMFNGLWYANGSTNGWNSDSGWVLNGVLTSLNSSGVGDWEGNYYRNGQIYTPASPSGYDATSSNYYINGQRTTLSSAGNGMYNGIWYANGTTNGWNSDSGYVLNGVLVGVGQGLDQNGTGHWNGSTYANGVLVSTP